MTENVVEWEVWSDKMIPESTALYAVKKAHTPYCPYCKNNSETELKKFEGKTYFQQTQAIVELIDFYGEDLYAVKFGLADTNLKFIRARLLMPPKCTGGK